MSVGFPLILLLRRRKWEGKEDENQFWTQITGIKVIFFVIKLFSLPPPSVQSHKFVNKNTIIISTLFFYGCIFNFQRNHFRLRLFIAMMYISLRDKGHLQRPSSWSLENKRNPNQSQENKEKSWQQSHRTILHKTLGKWRTQVSALNLMESDAFSLNIIKV